MTIRRLSALVLLVALSYALTGCDRSAEHPSPSHPSSNASSTTQPSDHATANVNTNTKTNNAAASFKQSWASSSADLTGTWFCPDEGLYVGLSFQPQKNLRATKTFQDALQNTNTASFAYEKLNDNRLLLIDSDGQAKVLQAHINAGLLILETSDAKRYQYQQLPQGQTITQAAQNFRNAKNVAFNVRKKAVEKFLSRPGLLMTIDPQAGKNIPNTAGPHVVALSLKTATQIDDALQYTGSAWYDTYPPIVADLSLKLPSSTDHALSHDLTGHLGPVTAKANSALQSSAVLGDFAFDVIGDNDRLQLSSVSIGHDKNAKATLWHDPSRHDAIIKKFKEESVRIQAMQQAIVDAIKEFAVLQGTSVQAQPDSKTSNLLGIPPANSATSFSEDQIILLRDSTSASPRWRGEIRITTNSHDPLTQATTRQAHTLRFTSATIAIKNDAAWLVIPVGSRIYQYQLRGSFVGHWSNIASPARYTSQMKIIQATDMITHLANLQAQNAKLNTITSADNFLGLVPMQSTINQTTPIVMQLTTMPDDTITANVYYTFFRTYVRMKGQVHQGMRGPSISLALNDIPPNQKNMRVPASMLAQQLGKQQWLLQLADTGPILRLVGNFEHNQRHTFVLDHASDIWQAKHDALLKQLLTQNSKMTVTLPAITSGNQPTIIALNQNQTTKQITGTLTGRSLAPMLAIPAASKPADITGTLTNQGPWRGLTLKISYQDQSYTMNLIVFEKQNKPALYGVFYTDKASQSETYIQLEQAAQ